MCLTETHLRRGEIIHVPGYHFIGRNRELLNTKANRGSGGVGILIKNSMINTHHMTTIYTHKDNVIAIKLECKLSGQEIVIFCVYLPPEHSRYGSDNEEILNGITMEIYKHCEVDHTPICGDFNTRTGEQPDCLDYDNIP